MELVITDAQGKDLYMLGGYELDIAYGESENDFELTLPDSKRKLDKSSFWYVDNTELGGIVDTIESGWTRKGKVTKYRGRSIQGILANKVIKPPHGLSHLDVTGDANVILAQIIEGLDLPLFKADTNPSGIEVTYRFPRYITAYEGILHMLMTHNATLSITCRQDGITLSAKPSKVYDLYSEQRDFTIEQTLNVPNHMVCLGQGELAQRTVIDLYADVEGNISQTQSIFGNDEITTIYENTNSDEPTLIEEGTKNLSDLQTGGDIELSINDKSVKLDIGQIVTAQDNALTVAGLVTKKIVVVSHGVANYTYEIGNTIAAGTAINL